ncbi:MAG: hypothetical protein N4A49_14980 [Marinifilaceae bacterium]|jgi:hypothetical protein|nr:hypothetical protein [Marinifilaceae bacterium]
MKIKKPNTNIFLILILAIFNYSCSDRSELKEKGIKTTAIVVDGVSIENEDRNFGTYTTYEIELEFENSNGKKIKVKESISGQEYNRLYLNCKVPIIYLPEDPTKVDVILTDGDVLFYYGIANRPLYLEELYKVYNESNTDSITNYLNNVSFRWEGNTTETTTYWENHNTKELIVLNSGMLTYATYNFMWRKKFLSELENNGYVKTQKDSTGTEIFENENYKIASSQKIDKNEQTRSLSKCFVVSMVKTDND